MSCNFKYLLIYCFWFSSSCLAASFDCGKAISPLEKVICENQGISILDETMAAEYSHAKKKLSDEGKQILRDGQRRWLRYVNDVCFKFKNDQGGLTCVSEALSKRIGELEKATVPIGPYTFSRVDYYYAESDDAFGRPSLFNASYPRIENASSDELKKWNTLMDTSSKDLKDWPGTEVEIDFEINFATNTMISAQIYHSFLGHGAAHPYGGSDGETYIFMPELRQLTAKDLFSHNKSWEDLLTDKFYAAEKLRVEGVDRQDVKKVVIDPKNWTITNKGITISVTAGALLPWSAGTLETSVSWNELRPYLVSTAPVPHGLTK